MKLSDKELKERMEHFINKNNPAKDVIHIPETNQNLSLADVIKELKMINPNSYFYLDALIRYELERIQISQKKIEEMKINFRLFMIPQENFQREIQELNNKIKELENLNKKTEEIVKTKNEELKRTMDILQSIQKEKEILWDKIPKEKKEVKTSFKG